MDRAEALRGALAVRQKAIQEAEEAFKRLVLQLHTVLSRRQRAVGEQYTALALLQKIGEAGPPPVEHQLPALNNDAVDEFTQGFRNESHLLEFIEVQAVEAAAPAFDDILKPDNV